mmetsp:Transcript_12434/g.18337  ORF Transcript_12434/g.18337 Transcript_12434/m.18337 type:complete len:90 (+) Transcript_12434:109-378(+)
MSWGKGLNSQDLHSAQPTLGAFFLGFPAFSPLAQPLFIFLWYIPPLSFVLGDLGATLLPALAAPLSFVTKLCQGFEHFIANRVVSLPAT